MILYRFLDGMGDEVAQGQFTDNRAALAWSQDETVDHDIQRVEYQGRDGDWRWAGALGG